MLFFIRNFKFNSTIRYKQILKSLIFIKSQLYCRQSMMKDLEKDISIISEISQAMSLLVKTQEETFIPFKLAYYPYRTSLKTFQELQEVQKVLQKLLLKASKDQNLVKNTFETVSKSDHMLGKFYQIFLKKVTLGQSSDSMILLRGDYFLNDKNLFKLIQYNLVSVCMSTHSQNYQKARELLDIKKQIKFVPNTPLTDIGQSISSLYKQKKLNGIVLFIVSLNDRNVIDQVNTMLELYKRGIKAKKEPLCNLHKKLTRNDNKLFFQGEEVSVAYYRTGYLPSDYTEGNNEQQCWKVKQMIQLNSNVIKIPNITIDLMNQKRMQTELSKKQVYERFLDEKQCKIYQTALVKNWDFDVDQQQNQIIQMIKKEGAHRFVLKPNLQGGGNTIFNQEILKILQQSTSLQRKKYILMQKINTLPLQNVIFRGKKYQKLSTISQISKFGIITQIDNEIFQNTTGGYFIRVKEQNMNQSGVMIGSGAFGLWAFKQQQNKQNMQQK